MDGGNVDHKEKQHKVLFEMKCLQEETISLNRKLKKLSSVTNEPESKQLDENSFELETDVIRLLIETKQFESKLTLEKTKIKVCLIIHLNI